MKISDFSIQKHAKFYYRGEWSNAIFKKTIAIVGSRRMTRYGREVVDKFVADLVANGVTTISGFMYGVDTEVALKTVEYGGRHIAVFGCGLDCIYPPENEKLYIQILENKGLVISEYEPNAKPHLWKFPQRNKIVARLATLGVLVIEAGEESGSLITAKLARQMGKKVYAVPGPITSPVSVGCNNLIKNGDGVMVTSVGNILKLKSSHLAKASREGPELVGLENKIYKALQTEPLDADEISAKIRESVVEIGSALSLMSLKGLLTESGGKYYIS